MRILSVAVNGLLDEGVDKLYHFDQLNESVKTALFDGNDIPAIINYVFLDKTIGVNSDGSAEVIFRVKDDEYVITRTRAQGKDTTVLKQIKDGKAQRLSKPYETLAQIFECEIAEQFSGYLIEKSGFERFEKQPSLFYFDSIRKLREPAENARKSYLQVLEQAQEAEKNIKGLAKKVPEVTEATVQSCTQAWNDKEKEYRALSEQISSIEEAIKTAQKNSPLKEQQLSIESKITKLLKNQEYINALRAKIADHHKVQKLIPKLQEILAYRKQVTDAAASLSENRKQNARLSEERSKLVESMDALNEEIKRLLEKSSRVIIVRDDEVPNTFADINVEEELQSLETQRNQLEEELAAGKVRVKELEAIIEEVRGEMQENEVPAVSIPELIENIRNDVKMNDLQASVSEKEADIEATREKIAAKEASMQEMQGQLTNLLALDKTLAPIKGKDEISRLLQSKIKKSEYMIETLEAKGSRLEQEIRTLGEREREIDLSLGGLQSTLTDKQNDRDKFMKLQALKVNMENGVARDRSLILSANQAPMSSIFIDEHVASIQGDIERRTNKKIEIISEKVALEYVLKEIKRQKDIAAGDIAASRKEQQVLEEKIAKLTERTDDGLAKKYLEAFDRGESTEFILDYQKTLVKTQTEYEMLVADVNKKLQEKSDLAARLNALSENGVGKYLSELLSGGAAQSKYNPAQRLIAAQNELLRKGELIKEQEYKLVAVKGKTAQYQQFQAAVRRGEKTDAVTPEEAARIKEENETAMNKMLAEKEVIERNIADTDAALLSLKAEGEKVVRELQLLRDTAGGKKDIAARLMDDLQGESIGSIKQKSLAPQDLERYRTSVEKYDSTLAALRKQSDSIRIKRSDETDNREVADLQQRLDNAQTKRRQLSVELERLKKKMNEAMDGYLAYNKYKVDMAKASNELAVAENLKEVLKQTKIVEQLYKQRLTKYVKQADKIFNLLTDGQYSLDVQDDVIFTGKDEGKAVDFAEMTIINRYMAYIALRSALPDVTNGSCDSLVFKGEIKADKAELVERLARLTDKNFITRVGKPEAPSPKKTGKSKNQA